MIIKPMRDKKTKKILTNVEICRRMYSTLTEMKEKSEPSEYYGIFGGSSTEQEVMSFLKQINDEKDDKTAQQMVQNYILPTIMKGVK